MSLNSKQQVVSTEQISNHGDGKLYVYGDVPSAFLFVPFCFSFHKTKDKAKQHEMFWRKQRRMLLVWSIPTQRMSSK